jgi:hypothetical protein
MRAYASAGFGWWKAHPWIAWWLALPVTFLVLAVLATVAGAVLDDIPPIGAVIGVVAIGIVLFLVATFFRGMVVSWRKSKIRSLFTVGLPVILVAAIVIAAIPLYNNIGWRARPAKAQADARSLASAVSMYAAHMDRLPASLADVTRPSTNARGETAAAFLNSVPPPAAGWTPYRYEAGRDGESFRISSTGDGMTAEVGTTK